MADADAIPIQFDDDDVDVMRWKWSDFFSQKCIRHPRLPPQVGVQCEVDPQAGASALEDKVNSILPLVRKHGDQ